MKFQDDISNMNTYIHTYVHTYGQAETNMPPHFFKVGGIIKLDSLAAQASDIDMNFIDRFSHNEALTLKCFKP